MAAQHIRRESQSTSADYDIAEEEEYYVTRPHTSVRRYRQPVQRDTQEEYPDEQTTYMPPSHRRPGGVVPAMNRIPSRELDEPISSLPRRRRRSPWLALSIGMLITIGLIIGFSAFASWWQLHQD